MKLDIAAGQTPLPMAKAFGDALAQHKAIAKEITSIQGLYFSGFPIHSYPAPLYTGRCVTTELKGNTVL